MEVLQIIGGISGVAAFSAWLSASSESSNFDKCKKNLDNLLFAESHSQASLKLGEPPKYLAYYGMISNPTFQSLLDKKPVIASRFISFRRDQETITTMVQETQINREGDTGFGLLFSPNPNKIVGSTTKNVPRTRSEIHESLVQEDLLFPDALLIKGQLGQLSLSFSRHQHLLTKTVTTRIDMKPFESPYRSLADAFDFQTLKEKEKEKERENEREREREKEKERERKQFHNQSDKREKEKERENPTINNGGININLNNSSNNSSNNTNTNNSGSGSGSGNGSGTTRTLIGYQHDESCYLPRQTVLLLADFYKTEDEKKETCLGYQDNKNRKSLLFVNQTLDQVLTKQKEHLNQSRHNLKWTAGVGWAASFIAIGCGYFLR